MIKHVEGSRGQVTIDTELLKEALERWEGVCLLAGRLCNELEDAPYDIAKNFDTEELSHHAVSEYTTDVQRELRELIADLEEV